MKQPRLAYLCLETPHEGQATYTHVHEIINGLREIGWQVDLVATERGGASSNSSYFTRLMGYVAAQATLVRRLGDVDGVYMRSHFAALPAALVARLRGVPVFQEINGLPDDIFVTYRWLAWIGAPIRMLYAWQLRMASHVFVVTDGLRSWAVAQGRHERVSVVSNGANTRLFNPEGPASPIPAPYIAFVGGLTRWHGISTMIAATREAGWPDGVRLVVVGDGAERAQLDGLAGDPRIVVLGRRSQAEAAAILRGALGALSITEDSSGHLDTGVAPLKLFEAMASGTAMIVTDLPFQGDLIRSRQAGLVIPMANPAALAAAAARLAADPAAARQMGRNGATYVAQEASWLRRAEEIADVIRARLNAPNGAGG